MEIICVMKNRAHPALKKDRSPLLCTGWAWAAIVALCVLVEVLWKLTKRSGCFLAFNSSVWLLDFLFSCSQPLAPSCRDWGEFVWKATWWWCMEFWCHSPHEEDLPGFLLRFVSLCLVVVEKPTGQRVQMFVRLCMGLPVIPDVVNPNASMSQGWNDGGRAIQNQLSVGFWWSQTSVCLYFN